MGSSTYTIRAVLRKVSYEVGTEICDTARSSVPISCIGGYAVSWGCMKKFPP